MTIYWKAAPGQTCKVCRKPKGSNGWRHITTMRGGTYADPKPQAGEAYQVMAINAAGESLPSNIGI